MTDTLLANAGQLLCGACAFSVVIYCVAKILTAPRGLR